MGAKHYQASENVLKAAADINSKSEAVYFELAVAQTKSNKKTDAIASPAKAIETDANSERSLLLLGMIERDIQEYDKAEVSFLKIKKLNGNKSADTNWQVALLY